MKLKPNNPRKISDEELERLEIDLERFGDLSGIVHNEATDYLVGGNQRANVMEIVDEGALTIEHEYDPPTRTGTVAEGFFTWRGERYVYRRVRWDADREDAACIIANLRGGDWDWDALGDWNVDDLVGFGFDVEELALEGFDLGEDEPPDDPGAQVDRAEELREKWGVSDGDLWRLGDHRLVCGDCTDAAVVARVMDGEKIVDLSVLDPPYEIDAEIQASIVLDSLSFSKTVALFGGITELYNVLKKTPKPFYDYAWHQVGFGVELGSMQPIRHHRTVIVWLGDIDYDIRSLDDGIDAGFTCWSSHIIAPRPTGGDRIHKMQKSLDGYRYLVAFNSIKDGNVYDPFIGSGTTMVACEQLGRRCYGIEIDPSTIALCLQRLADMGLEPHLVDVQ